jgi:hypothetical protein
LRVWQPYDWHCFWCATHYDRWALLDSPALSCHYRKRAFFVHHFAIFTRHLGFGHFVQLGFSHPFSTSFGHSIRSLHRLDSPAIFCPYRKRAWFAHHFAIFTRHPGFGHFVQLGLGKPQQCRRYSAPT